MDNKTFINILENRISLTNKMLQTKNKEYANDDEKFLNFIKAGRMMGVTKEKALWGMLIKHIVSVMDLINNEKEPTKELVSEKIGDIVNYYIILEAMFYENIDACGYLRCESKIKGDEDGN